MSDAGLGRGEEGPVLQAPLSASIPVKPEDVAGAQPEVSGQPTAPTPPGTETLPAAEVPAIPGLDETTWTELSPEDRARLTPVLKKIEAGVSGKLMHVAEIQRKADLLDSTFQIPEFVELYKRLQNREPLTPPSTIQSGGESDANDLSDLDGDPQALRGFIQKTVQEAVLSAVGPLQDQVHVSAQAVSQMVLENERRKLEEADQPLFEDALRLLQSKRAQTLGDAIALVKKDRGLPAAPPAAPSPPPPAPDQTVTVPPHPSLLPGVSIAREAGPPRGRMYPRQVSGKITGDIVAETARQLGLEF